MNDSITIGLLEAAITVAGAVIGCIGIGYGWGRRDGWMRGWDVGFMGGRRDGYQRRLCEEIDERRMEHEAREAMGA